MAFVHGKDSSLLVAEFDLGSALVRSFTAGSTVTTHRTETLGDDDAERTGGLADGQFSYAGLFDADYDDDLEGYLASAAGEPVTVIFGTQAEGSYGRVGTIKQASYNISDPVGDMVRVDVQGEPDGGFRFGVVLTPLTSKTSNSSSSGQDRLGGLTAATSNGLIATIHCTAVDTLTSLDVDIEDSTDDNTYATLGSFTQLTGVGSEVLTVAKGTNIDRYLRATWTIVGTAATFVVTAARL